MPEYDDGVRSALPLIAIFFSAAVAFGQSSDTLILKDAIDAAGLRAQMAAQGYSSQYIDYYLSKRRQSAYVVGQTPAHAAEAAVELPLLTQFTPEGGSVLAGMGL